MNKLLKEPFFHFVLIGALLFVIYGAVNDDFAPDDNTIVVTEGKIEHIKTVFAKTWQRTPTDKELEGLIEDYLKEEVFYREATRMGMDNDDIIIRRRMRQKMEFVAEDLASTLEPTDEELQKYLDENADYFNIPPRYSFAQVYLNPDRYTTTTLEQAGESLIGQLESVPADADLSRYGDRIMVEQHFKRVTPFEIERTFGTTFAEEMGQIAVGQWVGPVRSGIGFHIVNVTEVEAGYKPQLDEVRELVIREWDNTKRLETLEAFYQGLRSNYEVIIETPEALDQ